MESPITLTFDRGTVVPTGGTPEQLQALPNALFDSRTNGYRIEARHYRAAVEHLRRNRIVYVDNARDWATTPMPWKRQTQRQPFPHQSEALEAWTEAGSRGMVILPTGTGKTFVAVLAIEKLARPALIITPTLDLMRQWQDELAAAFGVPVGVMGGGEHDLQPLTVTTYDSAYIHLERWGNRYALVVFDECHHLPGPSYLYIAVGSMAPYRLGLTATPERGDGQDSLLPSLIGATVYRREIRELAGDFLAEYTTHRLYVDLSPEEEEQYRKCREQYRQFLANAGISLGGPNGWSNFIQAASRSTEGRAAFQAFREQRRLSLAAPSKLNKLEELLAKHAQDRILVFTYDNATVYQIARRFLVPAITHQTKTKERRQILERFHSGEYPVVVSGQVLNEGVDVPAASVGVILSGTGTVREHVQRLGRLLRKHGEKQALLYEVVTRNTAEEFTSERRRQHHAYR